MKMGTQDGYENDIGNVKVDGNNITECEKENESSTRMRKRSGDANEHVNQKGMGMKMRPRGVNEYRNEMDTRMVKRFEDVNNTRAGLIKTSEM